MLSVMEEQSFYLFTNAAPSNLYLRYDTLVLVVVHLQVLYDSEFEMFVFFIFI